MYNKSIQHHCLQESLSKNAVIWNRDCLSKTFDFEVAAASWSEIVFNSLHGADQLIRRRLDVNEEKYIVFKNYIFYCVFRFVIAKVCCLIGTAVHFDGLFTVSLSGDFFLLLYKFEVSIAK